ncbi:F-box protein [Salix suchowensis]|nr:F-box protein [Salix suchowensis]
MADLGCLNTDIPFNVLSRLQTKDLLGLKCVSKGWKHLISDRSFIQAQSQRKEPLSGFFFQQRHRYCPDDIKTITYFPVERKGLQQDVFAFLPRDVVVLASCHGLVCCRSCYPFEDPAIYVCNPLNCEWWRLDWKEPDKESFISLAFNPSQDISVNLTNFKVVRPRQFETEQGGAYFSFEIYASRTRNWKLSKEVCWCDNSLSKNGGIFSGGILHWITDGDQILTFSVENELALLISTPLPVGEFNSTPQACIGESEGQLYYVLISEEGFHVWILEDYFDSTWSLRYTKTLGQIEKEHSGFFVNLYDRVMHWPRIDDRPWMDPLAFKDGVLVVRISNTIYLYHVDTSKMEEVCETSKFGAMSWASPTVLPYTMSLVPLAEPLKKKLEIEWDSSE